MEFKVGDKITAFGNAGIIKSLSPNGLFLIVRFTDVDHDVIFNTDGRLFKWNKTPILKKSKRKRA
jgi:hypothetical protein